MANAHLQRNPTNLGDRSTYTWSGWIKRNQIGGWERLFSTAGQTMIQLTGASPPDQIRYFHQMTGNFDLRSGALLRDIGSWMHIVISVDHTHQHSKNRVRIYVNGAEVDNYGTDSTSNGSQNLTTYFNSLTEHALLGRETTNAGENLRGEAFDIFWVDGQALTADVFGFYKDGDGYESSGTTNRTDFKSGQWSPRLPKSIKHTINGGGGFGVNGFYIPLNDGSNFGADFHCTPNSIVKLKGEDEPQPRNGAPTTSDAFVSQLRSDPFAANLILAVPFISHPTGSNLLGSFGALDSSTGWSLADPAAPTISGGKAIWDGTSGAGLLQRAENPAVVTSGNYYIIKFTMTRTAGTLQVRTGNGSYSSTFTESGNHTVVVKAGSSTTETILFYGNSFNGTVDDVEIYQQDTIRDYSADIKGSGTNKTVTVKGTFSVGDCPSYYGSALLCNPGTDGYAEIAANAEFANLWDVDHTIEFWYKNDSWDGSYLPHASLIGLRHSTSNVAWRFSFTDKNSAGEDGIQLFGTNGFSTGASLLNNDWNHCAVEQYTSGGATKVTIYVNGIAAGSNTGPVGYESNKASTGPIIIGTDPRAANLGDTYSYNGQIQDVRIYKGVAKYKGGFDVPKPYTPKDIETNRARVSTCKNNFVTMSLIATGSQNITLSNGNLTAADSSTSGGQIYATMGSNTGKWYYEAHVTQVGGPSAQIIGINPLRRVYSNTQNRTGYRSSGDVFSDSGTVQSGTSYTTGDIIGVAWDADNKKLWFAKNGSWVYSGDPANGTNAAVTYTNTETQGPFLAYDNGAVSQVTNFNFGQNPSFSGNVTTGTNADGNGKGLFKYAPPTGFLALCDDNLPTPAIADPGKHFKAVLWTGDGNTGHSISKVGFKPDLVWIANRERNTYKPVFDSVRGATNMLRSNQNVAQGSFNTVLQSFDSDGFTVGDDGAHNASGEQVVGWCWKAGGVAVTNNVGSVSSQVSANQEAGFSVVKFTAQTSGSVTVGHGLGKKPAFWIWKDINSATGWYVYHQRMGASAWLVLNDDTAATTGNTAAWGGVEPTTTVLTHGWGLANQNDVIMYIWAEIENYSKFGDFFGNNNAEGPFVYCGFKPAWLMIKSRTVAQGNWIIYDSSRSSKNVNGLRLAANISDYENESNTNLGSDSSEGVDFLSNGFKIRTIGLNHNNNNEEYIFAAFAESPFQTANAK